MYLMIFLKNDGCDELNAAIAGLDMFRDLIGLEGEKIDR